MLEESIALANVIPQNAAVVLLDSRGENLDSAGFATQLTKWRANGRPAVVFLIGGADGLAPGLRDKAELRLSFGAATWPHQLVRVMLLEQLYRATTILSRAPLPPGDEILLTYCTPIWSQSASIRLRRQWSCRSNLRA